MSNLPVAVIGAGPIGLAAAAELVARGEGVVVLERGVVAAGVRSWGHVRLFSPWSEVISPAAESLLGEIGWRRPDLDRFPTGRDWVADYLQPLADVLGERVRTDTEIVGVARRGRDLVVSSGRDEQPFVLHVRDADGRPDRVVARAVIDASGTVGRPSPLGADGYPAVGEDAAATRVTYGMPDPTDARWSGRAVAVVGSGASALTSLLALDDQRLRAAGSRLVWVLRRGEVGDSLGGGEADELPARGALGTRVREAVRARRIEVVTGFRTVAVEQVGDQVGLRASDGRMIDHLDRVVGVTGYRPDLSLLSEVRLDLDPVLQAPRSLAPEIDPNVHSCGSVQPHGHRHLEQPERGLYLAGMKAYGRAPSFLAMTGHEQVRSIAAALAGDLAAADDVRLTLPETGVCHGAGTFDEVDVDGGACCRKVS